MTKPISRAGKVLRRTTAVAFTAALAVGGLHVTGAHNSPAHAAPKAPSAAELQAAATASVELSSTLQRFPIMGSLSSFGAPNRPPAKQPPTPSRPVQPKPGTDEKAAPKIGPGQLVSVVTTSSGKSRRYLLEVPLGYDDYHAAPVLFGFGGWKHSPEEYRSYANFERTGAALEAIRIYPEGLASAWEGAPYAVTSRGEDVRFVKQILEEVARTYNIDRKRVYATGLSNGGGMVAALACQAPSTFAGVAAVAGAYYDPVNTGCANAGVPFLFIHGERDNTVHFMGGRRHGVHYFSIPQMVHSYKARNGCFGDPVKTPMINGLRHTYACTGTEVELVAFHGGHTWPITPDAAQEIWNFFSRQHR